MNTAMEMHDSVVLKYERFPDGTGFILFRAVVFRSDGRPAIDTGVSGWQGVRMAFTEMVLEARFQTTNRTPLTVICQSIA
ncbi:hypothetical protein HDF16_003064 [Granulicella aggregans]|uniref:Uncharacterized protein n=1 Tax=Granulicella aggregans TaxID=474949 RepID=A0A7W7ZEB9_9BACT|nr:hypothetical protein [Granulicella aggregans]MBB5058350.1 hypothetical protein [Granulicella aggregans]